MLIVPAFEIVLFGITSLHSVNSLKKIHINLLAAITITFTLGWLYQHASATLCYSKLGFVYGGNLIFWSFAIAPVRDAFRIRINKYSFQRGLVVTGLITLTFNQLFVYLFVEGLFSVLYTCDANITISDWMLTNGILSNLITFGIIIVSYFDQSLTMGKQAPPSNEPITFQIKQNGRTHLIAAHEIIKLEADNNSVNIHTCDKRYVQYGRLKDWESDLRDQGFVRIHRSYVINQRFIQAYQAKPSGDGMLTLLNGDKLRVSRSYRSNLYTAGQLQVRPR